MNSNQLTLEALTLAIQEQKEVLCELQQTVKSITTAEIPYWVTLTEAAKLKGGSTKTTLAHKPWQQPCCGTNYRRANGHRVWARAQIIEWLQITDDKLEDYAKKYNVDISNVFKNGKTINK